MSIFKAYDIRGVYPTEINEDIAYKIGRAFVTFLKVKEVLVARDIRLSSNSLHDAVTRGIMDQGASIIDIGLATTPMYYYGVAKYGYPGGLMITASHNPKQYNGFKMVLKGALPMSNENGILDIKSLVEKNAFANPKNKGKITNKDILKEYQDHLLSFLNKDSLKKFKVVVDTGNAMAGLVAPGIFEKIKDKVDVVKMFFELDGNFPNHPPNPLDEENISEIKKRVVKEKADLGVVFDGDGDRIFFIDENGEVVSSNFISSLVIEKLLRKSPGKTVLYDLRSSWIIKETIERCGGKAIMSRVGHSFIKLRMREEDAVFASELSAHYYMKDNFFIESSFVMIFKILEILSEKKLSMSEAIKPLKKYFFSGEINFEVHDKDAAMKSLTKKYSDGKLSTIDGIRIDFNSWWFNVRASNTEPLLRLNLEAKTEKEMKARIAEITSIIKKC